MIFTKKINLKLSFIGIIFMIFLVTTNKILIDFGLKRVLILYIILIMKNIKKH